MIKCPFCHFENEDGALFCERCTSDLTAVAPSPSPAKAAPPPPPPMHAVPPPMPMAEAVPFEAEPYVAEAMPFEAEPYVAEAMPFEAMTAHYAEPIAAFPLELEPIAPPPPPAPHVPAMADPAPLAALAIPAVEAHAAPPVAPPPPPAPAPAAPAPAAEPAPEAAATAPAGFLPPNSQPRLLVLRGQKRNVEYPIFEGPNFLGRSDEKPVDIDLEEQEPPDRVWCSRQHACIHWEDNQLLLEDLNSANGTYVNRTRVYPGQKRALSVNDIVQIGNVQLKVVV